MTNRIREKCVECGTPEDGSVRYLGDSQNPTAGAIKLSNTEMNAFLRAL